MAIKHRYYSIGDVAEELQVNTSKIRYWEQQFSQFVKPRRSRRGDRMFTQKDIENLKLIKHLVEDLKFTLSGAKQYMQLHKKELEAKVEVINRLESIKEQLIKLREEIE